MSKENPAKLAGNVNNNKQKRATSTGEQANKLHLSGVAISGSTQQNHDLTPSPSKTSTSAANGGGQAAAAGVSADSSPMSSPSKSCSSSPSKSSPSKSKNRNKKKNEAKRRSAELKRQQQQHQHQATTESAPARMHQSADKQASSASQAPTPSNQAQEEQKQEMKPSDIQPEPQEQDVKQSDETMDSISSPRLVVVDHVKGDEPSLVTSQPLDDHQPPLSEPAESGHNTDTNGTSHTLVIDQKDVNSNGQHQHQKAIVDTNSLRRKQKENRELREQLKAREVQFRELAERFKQQMSRTREVEASLVSTTRTCAQFEKLLQQELASRTRLEGENETLNSALTRLRNQVGVLEKEKSANNELIRVLNATLMERETEVSILKLKMTRIQTNSTSTTHVANMSQFNPPSSSSLVKNRDPQKAFTMAGRSNSEFSRNTKARSTMMAEAINARSSTSQLQHYSERDASVWATVPEELTPSKRPVLLERNLPNHIYNNSGIYNNESPSPIGGQQSSTPILRDRRYRTLPRSMKNPLQSSQRQDDEQHPKLVAGSSSSKQQVPLPQTPAKCIVTNLDEGNNTSKSSGEVTTGSPAEPTPRTTSAGVAAGDLSGLPVMAAPDTTTMQAKDSTSSKPSDTLLPPHDRVEQLSLPITLEKTKPPPHLPAPKSPSTPVKRGLKKILSKFKRSDSSTATGETQTQSRSDLKSTTSIVDPPAAEPSTSAFQRGATRSTLVGPPSNLRAQISPKRAIDFQTDKPFAEWDTDMLVDWLTMIGLSMYANQCRRWVKCGAHIMNATPAEVDKGLGITNHLHRKKLRLAISELNGDCDKITKAAAKLDYLWVARWLDDIGLPQHKEAFINARVDGRVLNYLTVEDLVSLGVKSLLHHSSIRCGIRVLRSINFDLQLLKRRATAEEIERMNTMRQNIDERSNSSLASKQTSATGSAGNAQEQQEQEQMRACDETDVPLWTCHRVMEWLRMIDFAEFAPNLRGSGVHGGLIMYEDAFNVDTMSTLLSIPSSRTLLRRHLSTFFENLVGGELAERKKQHKQLSSNQQLNPASEIKTHKKSPLWFGKLKSSKVGQDGAMDEYLCPMYPVEPQIVKNSSSSNSARKSSIESHTTPHREPSNLPIIPESINV